MDYFKLLIPKNNFDELENYLKSHDVNEELNGQTLLYWAVYHNSLQIVQYLVLRDADINKKDSLGRTAILLAVILAFMILLSFY